ncbi:Zinc finger domain-containing PHD-finger [Pyrenophora seminiperda CCB06]|uniref:Zinc finger domain-containing PHD-finger n=1 Tax=Pyrenophora seminiperda CCB06 TaxID=1302712 RepID=A0A3M7LY67_9PLEO|nr:Zinc finger domain-containing PHD-finger [Pyrenophora seminiperda CCB06]
MVLTIEFTSRMDAKEFYDYLGLEISGTLTHLSTSYDNILECPQGRRILPLTAYGKPLSIGLEVSMYWNGMPRESVLARCNRRMKPTIQPPSLNPPSQRYNLRFIYGNETLERSELICLHCSKRKTSDIYELQMHLISWHEYFNYKVIQEGVDENGVEHWRFHSEVADHRADQQQRTSNHADEPYDVRILAPAQQFDIMRFLKGDDGFQRAARVEKATSTKSILPPINKARKTPKEVQSRPLRKKKKYTIPKPPPGVTFFRSVSKRPLQPGEEVSESDDEFDEEWMFQRKHAEHKKDNLSESTIRFLKLFDGFMREENLQSIFHMGDAIIRFARQHSSQIAQPNDTIMSEFTQKLDELLEDDLITKEVHTAALEIVAAAQKPDNTNTNQPSQ